MIEKTRCDWCLSSENMMHYHDTFWGTPLHDDQELYAKLVLDLNQAGLSWNTILNKIENFYAAFDNFNIEKVAKYDDTDRERLIQNEGIIRNKLKVNAAIVNAQKVLAIQKEFGSFDAYLWGVVNRKVVENHLSDEASRPASTELSDRISKDMKKRGFKFTGTTVIYAYLQAVGIVNDHLTSCFRYQELTSQNKS
ncbi:DNA-3-methyladenine glycosylase I [Lactovum miscens]|uniref:DNA-3-methyladenine glycosylase I n=1 Tax=Lactovum miscens TaxID=190387 RepID=A0A841C7E0_9LACT|nr:DNA-3-methyladenine glycosylase I [Lactovum miscens]MBB5888395.1 DNA-3-methyladenine glycosylase I [Lactovum miscens]